MQGVVPLLDPADVGAAEEDAMLVYIADLYHFFKASQGTWWEGWRRRHRFTMLDLIFC